METRTQKDQLYHNPLGKLNIFVTFKNGARWKTCLHRLPIQLIRNAGIQLFKSAIAGHV